MTWIYQTLPVDAQAGVRQNFIFNNGAIPDSTSNSAGSDALTSSSTDSSTGFDVTPLMWIIAAILIYGFIFQKH